MPCGISGSASFRSGSEPVTQEAEPPRRAVRRGTETILLVEDDASVRALAAGILKRHGYVVLEACDGERTVEDIARQVPLFKSFSAASTRRNSELEK